MKKRITGEGVVYYNAYDPINAGFVIKSKDESDDVGYFDPKSGWWSDGCYMVLTGTLPKWQGKRKVSEQDRSKGFKSILADTKAKSNPAMVCGILKPCGDYIPAEDPPLVHVTDSSYNSRFYNVLYVDHVFTLYPKAKTYQVGERLVFRHKNKVVGIIMPKLYGGNDIMNDYFWMRFRVINNIPDAVIPAFKGMIVIGSRA